MRLATILLVVAVLCVASSEAWLFKDNEYVKMFQQFVTKFKRAYSTSAFAQKLIAFKANMDKITNYNKAAGKGAATFGVNDFADMTPAEFRAAYMGAKAGSKASFLESLEAMDAETGAGLSAEALQEDFAAGFDWRPKDIFVPTAPRDQGRCGSCWAWSAAGTIQAAVAISTGKKAELSVQAFVNCATTSSIADCRGCNGGYSTCAYDYAIKKGYFALSAAPYKGKNVKCDDAKLTPLGKITSYQKVERTPAAFSTAVKTNPLWVTLNADELPLYKGGVFGKEKNCSTAFNHAVILVGYGVDATSKKNFYAIRNSWGGTWGEKGYFRIESDGNTCGIHTNYGWYPKLK